MKLQKIDNQDTNMVLMAILWKNEEKLGTGGGGEMLCDCPHCQLSEINQFFKQSLKQGTGVIADALVSRRKVFGRLDTM